jgi:hypothetical protein
VTLEETFFGSAAGSLGGVGNFYETLLVENAVSRLWKAHTSAAVSQSSSHASATAFVLLMKGCRFPIKFLSNRVAVYIGLLQSSQSEMIWRIRSGRRPRLTCKKIWRISRWKGGSLGEVVPVARVDRLRKAKCGWR